jgi:hypothetical protein
MVVPVNFSDNHSVCGAVTGGNLTQIGMKLKFPAICQILLEINNLFIDRSIAD